MALSRIQDDGLKTDLGDWRWTSNYCEKEVSALPWFHRIDLGKYSVGGMKDFEGLRDLRKEVSAKVPVFSWIDSILEVWTLRP